MASTEEVLRGLYNDLGPMYEEFLGDLQKRGIAGAVRAKEEDGLYITPMERNGQTVDEETKRMLEDIVRQLSQDENPKTPSLEEFLRQVNDGSPADVFDKHSRQTAHERLVYGEDAVKSLVTNLMNQNRALAVRVERGNQALASALKAVATLKALAEEKHEHKFDERGLCSCGHKKAMSDRQDDEKSAAEAAEEKAEREKKEREEEEKRHEEALARVVNGALAPVMERLAATEKQLGIAPVGRSAESGGAPTGTSLSGQPGVLGRAFANPDAPGGSPAGVTSKGVSESSIKAFTDEAMALAVETDKKSHIDAHEMRQEVIAARAAWTLSTQPTPPKIDNPQIRALAVKHGLPIHQFGK